MKQALTTKLTQEYIKIDKHEQLINEELQKANERLQETVKKMRDRFEQELTNKLEEQAQKQSEAVRKLRDHEETQMTAALREAETKLTKQHEWQLREIREEQAHEVRQLIKRNEIEREDLESRFNRLQRDYSQLVDGIEERDNTINELAMQLDEERARFEQVNHESTYAH